VREKGSEVYGIKTEIKNLNSFRFVQQGVEYEAKRQIAAIEKGEPIIQATFGWDSEKNESVLQRVKESEQEYRYFPEPDLIPIEFLEEYIESLRASLPELPIPRKRRFMQEYGLPATDAAQLVSERATADYFEATAKRADPKLVANWMLGDLTRLANAASQSVYSTPITAEHLAGLVNAIGKGTITGKIAKELIEPMFTDGKTVEELIQERGIKVADAGVVQEIVERVIAANPDIVAKIRAGNEKSKGFLVGQVMKEARGQARPDDVNRLLDEALA
jgi:aspartyl-tRNA(Asn)/glutamyl-tRNA(Gln) amidotransferase subunit B